MKRATEIEEEAARWLVRLDAHGSPEGWAALEAWLNASPRHRAAFLRLSVFWQRADKLRRARPLDLADVDPDLLAPRRLRLRPPSWLRSRWAMATATAAAITLVAFGIATQSGHAGSEFETYATEVGHRAEEFKLQDLSSVTLNTNSEIRVSYSATRREVRLMRGQALFKVEHNAQRPFDVVAGATTVRAVGTAFTVQVRDKDSVEVIVTDGRVALNQPWTETLDKGSAALIVNGQRVRSWELDRPSMDTKLAWIDGRLAFTGQSMQEVVAEFNRYNRAQMVIADPSISTQPVYGSFEAFDPESFLRARRLEGHPSDPLFGPPIIRIETPAGSVD